MTERNVPIQSLIDHIKTAFDVDPWAKEMAEELLKEHEKVVRCKDCKHYEYAIGCVKWHDVCTGGDDWYCADGEAKE